MPKTKTIPTCFFQKSVSAQSKTLLGRVVKLTSSRSTFSSIAIELNVPRDAIELNVPRDDVSSIAIELTFVNLGRGLKKKPVQSSLISVTPGRRIF